MSKKSKTPRIDTEAAPARLAQPFAGLAGLREQLFGEAPREDAGPPVDDVPSAPRPQAAPRQRPPARQTTRINPDGSGPARAVVRYERKGRGGKEVTLVEKLGLGPDDLETWCRELKRALGCGGHVEESAIALAGDQRGRLPALLEGRGVRRISVS